MWLLRNKCWRAVFSHIVYYRVIISTCAITRIDHFPAKELRSFQVTPSYVTQVAQMQLLVEILKIPSFQNVYAVPAKHPNDSSKKTVISLSCPTIHRVQVKKPGKGLSCDGFCARSKEIAICERTHCYRTQRGIRIRICFVSHSHSGSTSIRWH